MTETIPNLPAVPGMMPFIHKVDTAPAYWWQDIYWVILVHGNDTGGRYSLMYEELPKGSGAPPHKHTRSDEHFYITEGEISFLVGDEIKTGIKGDFVFVPRNTRHASRVTRSVLKARPPHSSMATRPPGWRWPSPNCHAGAQPHDPAQGRDPAPQ